jgi:hypothetical protein
MDCRHPFKHFAPHITGKLSLAHTSKNLPPGLRPLSAGHADLARPAFISGFHHLFTL